MPETPWINGPTGCHTPSPGSAGETTRGTGAGMGRCDTAATEVDVEPAAVDPPGVVDVLAVDGVEPLVVAGSAASGVLFGIELSALGWPPFLGALWL